MIVYIVMTFLAVLFSAFGNKKKCSSNNTIVSKFFWYLSEFVLIIISGIRYNVGQDYFYTYVPYFNNLLIGHRNLDVEFGFYYLNKFIQLFTKDYCWLFIICSVIFFHFIYLAIFEQSKKPSLSIFLLISTTYVFIFYNGMRQMMAISIFLYSIKFIQNRDFKKYLLYMLIASSIHYSSLILIPLYFLYGIKINFLKSSVMILLILLTKQFIIKLILTIVNMTKYSYYIGSKYDTGDVSMIIIMINIAILVFSLLYVNSIKDENESKKYNFYVLLQLISTIIAICSGGVPLLIRLRWATGISIIILIPFSLSCIKKSKERFLILVAIILLYSSYSLYTIGVKNSNKVLPYTTIFERGK